MSQFWDDMLHMTEGEKLVEYWWLWLIIAVATGIFAYFSWKK